MRGVFGLTRPGSIDRLRRALLPPLCAASLLGCGGRATAGEELESPPGQSGAAGVSPPATGQGGRGGAPSTSRPIGTEPEVLPSCVPGFRESDARGRECAFIHEARCYEDDALACACACPRGGMCIITGFLDPEEPLPVSCRLQ